MKPTSKANYQNQMKNLTGDTCEKGKASRIDHQLIYKGSQFQRKGQTMNH